MSDLIATVTEVEKVFEPEDIIDGKHLFLNCMNCGCPLMDIWQTEPTPKPFWHVKAKCPHCGDGSEVTPVYSLRYHFSYIEQPDGKIYSIPSEFEEVKIRDKNILVWTCVAKDEWNNAK